MFSLVVFSAGLCSSGNTWLPLFTLLLLPLGVYVSQQAEKAWGHDSNRIVIDEVAGMAISLLFVPLRYDTFVIAFVLFRFFDIVKPLYIKKAARLPHGWGVMMDDVVAGFYTLACVWIYCLIVPA